LVLRVKTVKTDHTVFPSEALSAGSAGGASFLPEPGLLLFLVCRPGEPFLFLKKRNRENTSSWDAASKFRVSTQS
ncbi:MAG: hypothetical protein IJP07_02965, partial [Firmicutes bacterium]|nr:hypothetical protein [Bacillota bacterium]